MLEIYTCQIAKTNLLHNTGIEPLDTTVKSGDKTFAPTWDMVMGSKSGTLSHEEYERLYLGILNENFKNNPQAFYRILERPSIAFMCYCPANQFCHRHLLAAYFCELAEREGYEAILAHEIV